MSKQIDSDIGTAFKMIDLFKKSISELLVSEMKKRRMNKKEFSQYIGVSFPTFAKLVKNPDAQSISTIRKIFETLQADNGTIPVGE